MSFRMHCESCREETTLGGVPEVGDHLRCGTPACPGHWQVLQVHPVGFPAARWVVLCAVPPSDPVRDRLVQVFRAVAREMADDAAHPFASVALRLAYGDARGAVDLVVLHACGGRGRAPYQGVARATCAACRESTDLLGLTGSLGSA